MGMDGRRRAGVGGQNCDGALFTARPLSGHAHPVRRQQAPPQATVDKSEPRHSSQLHFGSNHDLRRHVGDHHGQTTTWGRYTPILTVALRRRASSPNTKAAGQTPQTPLRTATNRAYRRPRCGLWVSKWIRSVVRTLNATVLPRRRRGKQRYPLPAAETDLYPTHTQRPTPPGGLPRHRSAPTTDRTPTRGTCPNEPLLPQRLPHSHHRPSGGHQGAETPPLIVGARGVYPPLPRWSTAITQGVYPVDAPPATRSAARPYQ
jgi:hypothetical protein